MTEKIGLFLTKIIGIMITKINGSISLIYLNVTGETVKEFLR